MRRLGLNVMLGLVMLMGTLGAIACGAGDANTDKQAAAATVAAPGQYGEAEDASYIAYERVGFDRLPKNRMEPAGELRLTQQVRRVQTFRVKDSGASAIRFTDDAGKGWLAWQPAIVLRVRRELAQAENGQPSQVTTLSVNRTQWPDGCLGAPGQNNSCGAATAGFRIMLRLGSVTATYHTDLGERTIRVAG
jgi:hypothetical protein